jgi:acyl carrier protein
MHKKKIVLNIFKKRLNLSKVEIAKIENNKIEDFELGVHKNWDSLQHVNIISDLEKKMNLKINQKNFDLFSNLRKLFLYLKID